MNETGNSNDFWGYVYLCTQRSVHLKPTGFSKVASTSHTENQETAPARCARHSSRLARNFYFLKMGFTMKSDKRTVCTALKWKGRVTSVLHIPRKQSSVFFCYSRHTFIAFAQFISAEEFLWLRRICTYCCVQLVTIPLVVFAVCAVWRRNRPACRARLWPRGSWPRRCGVGPCGRRWRSRRSTRPSSLDTSRWARPHLTRRHDPPPSCATPCRAPRAAAVRRAPASPSSSTKTSGPLVSILQNKTSSL